MKKLQRSEMKNLKGGTNPPEGYVMAQSGWMLSGSTCYCDYRHVFEDGSEFNVCGQPCPTICCSAGFGCSLAIN